MIAQANAKFLRLSARKTRQVLDLIRGKDIITAQATLALLNKKANYYISKILNSAVSNAKHKGLKPEQLYISRVVAQEGPILKRFRAISFGRAAKIRRRTCHITLELDMK